MGQRETENGRAPEEAQVMQARETGTGLVEYLILRNFITGMLGKNSL